MLGNTILECGTLVNVTLCCEVCPAIELVCIHGADLYTYTSLIESRCTMAQIANLTFSSINGDLLGPGNGSEVVGKFLDQHQCNKYCKFFLPENNKVMGLMTRPMTE